MLSSSLQSDLLSWFQQALINGWLAEAENLFPQILPSRQPICLIAIEHERIIAYELLQPCNKRGSCWSISNPKLLNNPKGLTLRELNLKFFQTAIELQSNRAQSWIVRCPVLDKDLLGVTRELGFQQLKLFSNWAPPNKQDIAVQSSQIYNNMKGFKWSPITRATAPLLWSLEQASESAHLRQIIDRQWTDLLAQSTKENLVLLSNRESREVAVAGVIKRSGSAPEKIFEIVRDLCWDSRLSSAIPIVLEKYLSTSTNLKFTVATEDKPLNDLLSELKWNLVGEELLMGRSVWRRQTSNNIKTGTSPLESMLGRLRPQQPPLPTPSLEPR
ncbi:hypothetical protein [Prochlorococcus sp. MIT 1300]|uniref:hypothetical protein n=1 Tax=Prochlorococcus sp. MIT 1300 TaxID=3096218 RepID=UPI002A747D70|nr:hypothetical protein [Prochlorococcus sp. MIT 1300]